MTMYLLKFTLIGLIFWGAILYALGAPAWAWGLLIVFLVYDYFVGKKDRLEALWGQIAKRSFGNKLTPKDIEIIGKHYKKEDGKLQHD